MGKATQTYGNKTNIYPSFLNYEVIFSVIKKADSKLYSKIKANFKMLESKGSVAGTFWYGDKYFIYYFDSKELLCIPKHTYFTLTYDVNKQDSINNYFEDYEKSCREMEGQYSIPDNAIIEIAENLVMK